MSIRIERKNEVIFRIFLSYFRGIKSETLTGQITHERGIVTTVSFYSYLMIKESLMVFPGVRETVNVETFVAVDSVVNFS